MIMTNQKTGQTLSLHFRPFQEKDCQQIISCFQDAYGDSYIKPFVYTSEGIIAHQKSGELQFYVAETEDGEIISMIASELSSDFSGFVETASQVTRHEYAGFRLAAPMVAYELQQSLKMRPTHSHMAHPLCTYSISQKTVKTVGYTACGFLLHQFHKDKFHQNSAIQDFEKLSLTVAVKPAECYKSEGSLWIPEELQDLGEMVYNNLGVAFSLSKEEKDSGGSFGKNLRKQGNYTESVDETHKTLTLQVKQGGEDFSSWLSQQIQKMSKTHPLATVNLYINVKDASCVSLYKEAKQQGFFFQGFLPCGFQEDYLILHHPLSLVFSIDEIPMIEEYKPFAQEIRRQLHER